MKLNKLDRNRAMNELKKGVSVSEVAKKYGVSYSAASYLKGQITGDNKEVTEFKENFSKDQLKRLTRLYKNGATIGQLSEDYETPRRVITAYINSLR